MLDAARVHARARAVGRRGAAVPAASRVRGDRARHPDAGHERHRAGETDQAAQANAAHPDPVPDRAPRRRERRAARLRRGRRRLPEQAGQRRTSSGRRSAVFIELFRKTRALARHERRAAARRSSSVRAAQEALERVNQELEQRVAGAHRGADAGASGRAARTRSACAWRWTWRRWPRGSGTSRAAR